MRRAGPLALVAAAACVQTAPVAAGERVYQKCYACHSLEGPDPTTQGPSLKAIGGGAVAAEPGFAYSPAMRVYAVKQQRWTRESLDTFLADPQAAVPGNEMGFFGVRDPEERHSLIEFLSRS